jgi:hypothetical protein
MLSQNDILSFASLFTGAKEFYGLTTVGEIVNGKAESTSQTVHEMPTPSIFSRHLQGQLSIGISPLKGDDTVQFGAIDIDDYKGNIMNIVRAIYKYDLPICPCFSKSKKLHLYFFFAVGTLAKDAVDLMRWYASAFRCNKNVEIFPKQLQRSMKNKAYSWINLPYFDADSDNHRKMVDEFGKPVSIDMFIERATQCVLSIDIHTARKETIPCYDAPPCILSGALLGDVGQGSRNTWLFSCAVYLKLKDEACDLDAQLTAINESLENPLPDQELRSTILQSLQRKTYFYQCAQLVDGCDKSRCMQLDYGVGSTKSTGLNYGDLVQVTTDPPTYEWEVNGQVMTFESERQLLQQERFRELCLRMLHIVPRKVDDNRWSKIVTKACENIRIKAPDTLLGDFSAGSIFLGHVCEFFNDKRRATNESQVNLGRVNLDESANRYMFTADSLLTFIKETKGFKEFKIEEIRRRIRDMGAYSSQNGYWYMPVDSIPDTSKPEVQIDLNLHEGESNDF